LGGTHMAGHQHFDGRSSDTGAPAWRLMIF
jgi:hypothetical protein